MSLTVICAASKELLRTESHRHCVMLTLVCHKHNLTNVAYFPMASQYSSHGGKWVLHLKFSRVMLPLKCLPWANGTLAITWIWTYLNYWLRTAKEGTGKRPLLNHEEMYQYESIHQKTALWRTSKHINCFEDFKSMSPADSPLCWNTRFTLLVPFKHNTIVLTLSGISLAMVAFGIWSKLMQCSCAFR